MHTNISRIMFTMLKLLAMNSIRRAMNKINNETIHKIEKCLHCHLRKELCVPNLSGLHSSKMSFSSASSSNASYLDLICE